MHGGVVGERMARVVATERLVGGAGGLGARGVEVFVVDAREQVGGEDVRVVDGGGAGRGSGGGDDALEHGAGVGDVAGGAGLAGEQAGGVGDGDAGVGGGAGVQTGEFFGGGGEFEIARLGPGIGRGGDGEKDGRQAGENEEGAKGGVGHGRTRTPAVFGGCGDGARKIRRTFARRARDGVGRRRNGPPGGFAPGRRMALVRAGSTRRLTLPARPVGVLRLFPLPFVFHGYSPTSHLQRLVRVYDRAVFRRLDFRA